MVHFGNSQLPPYEDGLPTENDQEMRCWAPCIGLRPYPMVINGEPDYMIMDVNLAIKLSNLMQAIKENLTPYWFSSIWSNANRIHPGEIMPLPTGEEWYPGHRQSIAVFWYLKADLIYNMEQRNGNVYVMTNKICGHSINGLLCCKVCRLCRLIIDSCSLNAQTMPDTWLIRQMYQN